VRYANAILLRTVTGKGATAPEQDAGGEFSRLVKFEI
jgi:hypothetical protein